MMRLLSKESQILRKRLRLLEDLILLKNFNPWGQ